jgi:hypothetical protein
MYRVTEWLQVEQAGESSTRSLSCLQAHTAMVHYLGEIVNLNLTIKSIDSYEHGVMCCYIYMMTYMKISTQP